MASGAGTRWGLVLAVWAAGLGAAAQYGKISVIFARMPELYPAAGSWISLSVSLVGALGVLLGVAAGLYVSAFGYRRTLVWSLWAGAAMSALQAFHLPFALFLGTRLIEGLSHLGVVVAGPVLIAQLSACKGRGVAMTLWSTFFAVAFTLLAWFGIPLADRWGVLPLFGAHAVVMGGLALLLAVVLRDVAVPERTTMPRLAALPGLHLPIYRSPWIAAPGAGWLFYTCCFVATLTVIPPYIAADMRGFVLGAMPLASIAVSMSLGVVLLRHMAAVRLTQLGFLACAGAVLWLWAVPGDPLAGISLAGAMGLVQGGSFAAVPQLNLKDEERAQASGAMAQTGNLGNTVGTPLMVLVLSYAGYGGMMAVLLGLFLCGGAVHMLLAVRRRALA
ncbi:membrane protein [Leisingera sp. ANG-M1]|uniref:MFS transporter n=1 Tax=Leisingera sp. ANG-M1 TaxID=1577895 RepID=UPI00057E7906|nr:MFS transporter [Leisingera sp. ANG-M1]KIC08381.1 membrane protein [Leisingera sp. ANG-M1]